MAKSKGFEEMPTSAKAAKAKVADAEINMSEEIRQAIVSLKDVTAPATKVAEVLSAKFPDSALISTKTADTKTFNTLVSGQRAKAAELLGVPYESKRGSSSDGVTITIGNILDVNTIRSMLKDPDDIGKVVAIAYKLGEEGNLSKIMGEYTRMMAQFENADKAAEMLAQMAKMGLRIE